MPPTAGKVPGPKCPPPPPKGLCEGNGFITCLHYEAMHRDATMCPPPLVCAKDANNCIDPHTCNDVLVRELIPCAEGETLCPSPVVEGRQPAPTCVPSENCAM